MAALSSSPSVLGLCPSCEAQGQIGSPCRNRVCLRHGTNFIPQPEARRALAQPPGLREPLNGQFVGDFLIVSRLGRGGFGKVMLGLQRPHFKLHSAVKLLEFEGRDERTNLKVLEKFENEAQALAVLQHPNIVRLLHFGSFQEQPYLAMEFVPGGRTLQSEMNRHMLGQMAFDPEVVRHVLDQILNALETAHEQNIIHRDIKPENIMLQDVIGDPWHVKLLDFGLAKVIQERRDTSLVLGTVTYMAPEQIEGKNLGPWTDLYALACIAFEFMTGHRAFGGRDNREILALKLSPEYDPFERVGDIGLPAVAVDFLRKALARTPEQRFRSCGELRTALAAVFETSSGTRAFSADLSRLADTDEVERLRLQEQRVAAERDALADPLDSSGRPIERALAHRVITTEPRMSVFPDGRPDVAKDSQRVITTEPRMPSFMGAGPDGTPDLRRVIAPERSVPVVPPMDAYWPESPLQTGAAPTGIRAHPRSRGARKRAGLALVALAAGGLVAVIVAQVTPPNEAAPPSEPRPTGVVAGTSPAAGAAARPRAETLDPAPATPATDARKPEPATSATDARKPEPPARAAEAPQPEPPARGPVEAPRPEPPVTPAAETPAPAPAAVAPVPPRAAALVITSTPPGVALFVDGEARGVTPFELRTRVGAAHTLELRPRGGPPLTRRITIAAEKQTAELRVPVVAKPAATPERPRPGPEATKPAATPIFIDD